MKKQIMMLDSIDGNEPSSLPSPQELEIIPSPLPGEGEGTEEVIDGQWRRGIWRGIEMWTCTRCQWDTLDGIEAAREYEARCVRCAPPPPYSSSGRVLVADKSGREVWGEKIGSD